ncbi:MAG: hypothetical protein ACR2NB_14775, partial [Solirubrobacteraceae bacterium]
PFARTGAPATLAGAALAGVLLLVGTHGLVLWQWSVGLVAGPLAFVAVLLATGEVTRENLSTATRVVRARVLRG